MALLQPIIFKPLSNILRWPKANLALGLIATVGLSIVGAVCDSESDPECRGQNLFHSISAVVFFVLYNANMVIVTCTHHRFAGAALAVLCVGLKARWLLHTSFAAKLGAPQDQTLLAIFEWLDTFAIQGWNLWYIYAHRPAATMDLTTPIAVPATPTNSVFVSLHTFGIAATTLHGANLLVTLVAAIVSGTIPAGTIPTIGELWVSPPGNWVSRWCVPLGGSCALLSHILVAMIESEGPSESGARRAAHRGVRAYPIASHALAVVGLGGLTIAGVANIEEGPDLHAFGTLVFVAGYTLFMVAHTVAKGASRAVSPSILVACTLSAALVLALPDRLLPAILVGDSPKAVCEWVFAIGSLVYFTGTMLSHGTRASSGGLMINADQDSLVQLKGRRSAPLRPPLLSAA
jgi:hypothetical protein